MDYATGCKLLPLPTGLQYYDRKDLHTDVHCMVTRVMWDILHANFAKERSLPWEELVPEQPDYRGNGSL